MPSGNVPDPHLAHIHQPEDWFQNEPFQFMGTGNTPYYPSGYYDILGGAPSFFPGHRPLDYHHGWLSRPSSEEHNKFLSSVGGSVNSAATFDPNDIFAHGGAGLEFGDPGGLPRYGIDPGGPIHLITNVSTDSSQVSSLYLSEEVCRYSVRKTHWY